MSRSDRRKARPRMLESLESRVLLASQVMGNVGRIVLSQFQPYGFRVPVGTQMRGVQLKGPLRVHVVTHGSDDLPGTQPLVNTGLVRRSQLNGGGFRTVGLQWDGVRVGGGVTVQGSDNEDDGLPPTMPGPQTLRNRGVIAHSQFNDGGFGVLEFTPDGKPVGREGRVGLQWRKTRVGGPVHVEIDVDVIQPGAGAASPAVAASPTSSLHVASAGDRPPGKVIDLTTNSGRIRGSQFNDGGFGDIGLQWSKVRVGRGVGTATNSLFIKPQRDQNPAITVENRVFGGDPFSRLVQAQGTASPVSPVVAASRADFPTTDTNSATSSGRIVRSQFNDGGFGDVGLQWRNVRVKRGVTVAHNSLTVQPENHGQGLITVRNVRFPIAPGGSNPPDPGPSRRLPADPAVVVEDGSPVKDLPVPTGPLSPFFPTPLSGPGTVTLPYPGHDRFENAATNSGLVRSGQMNVGGFGDQGLQWRDVRVGGRVRVVHNSLSVHPEGSKLAGISVANVAYGPPIAPGVASRLAVLPFAVISPGTISSGAGKVATTGEVLHPPNNRRLTNPQLAAASGTDVFLQWNGIDHRRGLVLVHNIIKITGVGPNTGPITLQNIRFPFAVPPLGPLATQALRPSVTVKARSQAHPHPHGRKERLLNTANNSGILDHAQFADGGFGDDGLQWRRVSIGGSVESVHNTLAVDATADSPPGDVSGPITISGVTFNSGALAGTRSRIANHRIVSPPDVFQRVSSHPINPGQALPQDPSVRDESTNSGILAGGQLAAGGANHALLQWQCVRVRGKVRVIDNILSISVLDRPSGPITISDVTFA